MKLDYVSLLQVQRDLYQMPRGFDRFREYLNTMIEPETGDLKLPLVGMNPMGKDHLPPFLDQLLAMDADGQAARATAEAETGLGDAPGEFRVTTVVSDDLMGGWTNRYASEFGHRFRTKAFDRRGWTTAILWTSETYTLEMIREEVLTCIYRFAYIQQHGYAHTLGEMLAQEGYAMRMAGATMPTLDDEDLAYTETVLAPYLMESGEPTLIAALFGDPGARELGYTPLGLSPRAGFALALHEANRAKGKQGEKMEAPNYTIRLFKPEDQAFLYEMLYQAIFVPEGSKPPPHDVIYRPELSKYVVEFGQQPGDLAYIAVDDMTQQPVGAVWLRLFTGEHKGYGYVDDQTPELSIAIMPNQRGRGVGHALLAQLLATAQESYLAVSLNVWTENRAFRLYQRLGFAVVAEEGPTVKMIKRFGPNANA